VKKGASIFKHALNLLKLTPVEEIHNASTTTATARVVATQKPSAEHTPAADVVHVQPLAKAPEPVDRSVRVVVETLAQMKRWHRCARKKKERETRRLTEWHRVLGGQAAGERTSDVMPERKPPAQNTVAPSACDRIEAKCKESNGATKPKTRNGRTTGKWYRILTMQGKRLPYLQRPYLQKRPQSCPNHQLWHWARVKRS
jgi:hypothetical protein